MRRSAAKAAAASNGRLAGNNVHLLLPFLSPSLSLSLCLSPSLSLSPSLPSAPTSVFLRCMKPVTPFSSPCQPARCTERRVPGCASGRASHATLGAEALRLRAHRSRPMMKWPARKGSGGGGGRSHSAELCALARTLPARCLIKPNNRGKSKRPTAFGSFQSVAAAAPPLL